MEKVISGAAGQQWEGKSKKQKEPVAEKKSETLVEKTA